MKVRGKYSKLVVISVVGFVLQAGDVLAQERTNDKNVIVEEVITIGTRSKRERSVSDSPVPIDVISGNDINSLGGTVDLTDNLRAMIPSYTATPATGDGSAFVRPTSLRGMAPDQVLILINGKRRHRSALIQFDAPAAGSGAHAPDIGMIPGIAVQHVEVLRDGAAAQYGSDAIAGVINFVTKNASESGEVQAQWGQHFEGESTLKLSGNLGLPLGHEGFLNLSLEMNDNDALSRGFQRADAQALIDAGVPGVGEDSPFDDAPLVQSWGRPEYDGVRLFANMSVPLGENASLYAFGNYSQTDGRYRFFYRPGYDTDCSLSSVHSSLRSLCGQGLNDLRQGYTPYLDGAQDDIGIVIGVDGETGSGTVYDFSLGYGKNELDYFLNNTINPDLGLDANGRVTQRDFDVGAYENEQLIINADFSHELSAELNIAVGAEWREETYTAVAGEPASYLGAGSNGFGGITDLNAGSFDRSNYGLYVDLEHDVSESFLLQYSGRYEDYKDFGGTLTGKLATRVNANNWLTLRGAVSTGFHAPTAGQANIEATNTNFGSGGVLIEEGLVRPTDPLAVAVGGKTLEEEESFSISAGFVAQLSDRTSLTLDLYQIDVDGRIYRTGEIPNGDSQISFYTNALDVETKGMDLVLNSGFEWGNDYLTNLSFAFSYNDVEVVGQTAVNGNLPVSSDRIDDIENNFPNERFVLSVDTQFGEHWSWMVRGNFYGKHYDERGSIGAAVSPSSELGATMYIDTELRFSFDESLTVALGAVNIFDEFVDEIGPPNANRVSAGLQYPRRSPANYEGGSWYLRASYMF